MWSYRQAFFTNIQLKGSVEVLQAILYKNEFLCSSITEGVLLQLVNLIGKAGFHPGVLNVLRVRESID